MRKPIPGIRYYYTSLLLPEFRDIRTRFGPLAATYIVFRWSFDLDECNFTDGVIAHRVALFVCEEEAAQYCDFRNYWTQKNDNTDPNLIPVPDVQPSKMVLASMTAAPG